MTPRTQRTLAGGLAAAVASGLVLWLLTPLAAQGSLTLPIGEPPWLLRDTRGLYLLAVLPLLWWTASWSLTDMPAIQRYVGAMVRSLVVGCVALALSQPSVQQDSTRVSAVFLVDVSDSVPDAALVRATQRIEQARAERGDNDVQLITFARQARAVPLVQDEPVKLQRHGEAGDGSNIQAALQLAMGLFAPGHLPHAILLSDGLQTHGDVLAEAPRVGVHGVRLSVEPLDEGPPAEVGIKDVAVPPRLKVGAPFNVRVTLFATAATTAKLKLFQGELLNGLDPVRELELPRGETTVEMRSVARVPGALTYRAQLTPQGADRFDANNRFERSVTVPGQPQVLYVEGERGTGSAFAQALGAAGFDVDVRGPSAMPQTARELSRFDFLVVSDVPAEQMSLSAAEAVERFVRGGGGFLMAGGPNSFGLGGYRGSRMERILPVRMDAEKRKDRPSLALALVIDKSGSMNGQKIELAKEAARATAELLGTDDYIGVVGFDASPVRVVRMQSARNRLSLLRGIGRLSAGGGTAIFPALDAAYQDLAAVRAKLKHVILLTDGQTQETGIPLLVQNMRADGITVSTIGLGRDVHRSLLQQAAQLGGGRAYFTSEPHNIPRLFMRETHTVARSAAVEEYVQARVASPADFLRSVPMAGAPLLRGYVATRARPSPAQLVLSSDLGEPLLARWRLGLGWSLAWTSDVKARWASQWLRWRHFSRFWAQLIREHMRRHQDRHFALQTERRGDEAVVTLDAIDEDDRFLNELLGTLTVKPPKGGGKAQVQQVALTQTAPGRYGARVRLQDHGSFALKASLTRDGKRVAVATGSVSHPFPAEYGGFEADRDTLIRAAGLTGGGTISDTSDVFDAAGRSILRYAERWSWPLWVAILLFVLDVTVRRIRWSRGEF